MNWEEVALTIYATANETVKGRLHECARDTRLSRQCSNQFRPVVFQIVLHLMMSYFLACILRRHRLQILYSISWSFLDSPFVSHAACQVKQLPECVSTNFLLNIYKMALETFLDVTSYMNYVQLMHAACYLIDSSFSPLGELIQTQLESSSTPCTIQYHSMFLIRFATEGLLFQSALFLLEMFDSHCGPTGFSKGPFSYDNS